MNRWTGLGRIGQDPEVKQTSNSNAVCNFSIACNETWKDKSGAKQERTEWIRCVAWGPLAETCGKYLTKGKEVLVEGRLQTREYEKEGIKRQSTECVVDKLVFVGSGQARDKDSGSQAPRNDFDSGSQARTADDGDAPPF
jgi:single-strand DNA-binding protein